MRYLWRERLYEQCIIYKEYKFRLSYEKDDIISSCNEPTTTAHKPTFNLELLQVVYYIRWACNFTSTRRTFSSSLHGECIIIDIQPTECTCIQHFINIATDPGSFVVFLDWDSFLFEADLSGISCKMLSFIEINQTYIILAFIY